MKLLAYKTCDVCEFVFFGCSRQRQTLYWYKRRSLIYEYSPVVDLSRNIHTVKNPWRLGSSSFQSARASSLMYSRKMYGASSFRMASSMIKDFIEIMRHPVVAVFTAVPVCTYVYVSLWCWPLPFSVSPSLKLTYQLRLYQSYGHSGRRREDAEGDWYVR